MGWNMLSFPFECTVRELLGNGEESGDGRAGGQGAGAGRERGPGARLLVSPLDEEQVKGRVGKERAVGGTR